MKPRTALPAISAAMGLAALAPCAAAHMLITYHTNEMPFDREFATEVGRNPPVTVPSSFLYWRIVKFEISFMTPDFELATGEAQHLQFDDPVITLKAFSLVGDDFLNPLTLASGSHLIIDTYPDEELPSYSFSLKFSEAGNPNDNLFSNGALDSWGRLGDGQEHYDEFAFNRFNWPFSMHDQTWYHDTTTYFFDTNVNEITIEHISLPEPFAPVLMLMGLTCIGLRKK